MIESLEPIRVLKPIRYRCEYFHVPTSSRIVFTVSIGSFDTEDDLGSAGEAMAKRAAATWIDETGIGHEWVPLGVVRVTDNMSVRIDPPIPATDIDSGPVKDRLMDCRRFPEHAGCDEQGHSFV